MSEPPGEIPEEFIEDFTMGGQIPVYPYYFNETECKTLDWSEGLVQHYINNYKNPRIYMRKHLPECYENASLYHLDAIQKYPIKGKDIAVIGSLTPWVESILLNNGASSVTTIEYNVPKCESSLIKCISYDEFKNSTVKYDAIFSYSSIEHSGLGRYGDPIDPWGDIKTMNEIFYHLKSNGLLYLGIPIGLDSVCWNAHRIYGPMRLKILFNKFEELNWIGLNKKYLDTCSASTSGPQPIIILRKKSLF